jgi:uncharacterized membrane protein
MSLAAVLAALCCIATFSTRIPVPASGGFIHAGDSIILISAIIFGPFYGLIAGGIGSMFANIFAGAVAWAPFTLVIKGLMGLLAGIIADYNKGNPKIFSIRNLLAVIVCEAIMVIGYFFAVIFMLDFSVAIGALLPDIIQAFGGALIYFILAPIIGKIRLLNV